MKNFALAGNPNSGKTTLFNALTGATAHVGNWPGVTVDKREGVYKKGDIKVNVIDLPGIYSLSPYTPEEVVARNYILDESPDAVINVVDATNLERNLYLTSQILEMDVPVIVALNMMDEVEKVGDKIDVAALEKALGVPVVPVSALTGKGMKELMQRAAAMNEKRVGSTILAGVLTKEVETAVSFYKAEGVSSPLFHAIKLLENDEIELEKKGAKEVLDEICANSKNDLEAVIADERYKYIVANFSVCKIKSKKHDALTKSDKIDTVLTHKIWGIPIFLVILFTMFHLTFAEDFLYLGAIFKLPALEMEEGFLASFVACFYDGAVFSPGVILFNLMDLLTSTVFGWIGAGVEALGASDWLLGLVNDGILAGLGGVLSFVPQIIFLLLLLSILEDTGYMARVAFIMDKIFRRFGVSGRAFIPMIMGFGCSVPAMINTRTLADERERVLTIRAIPFFTCGAKLPILAAVAGAVVMAFGIGNADVITYSMYVLGLVIAVVSIILMRSTTQRGEIAPFIMELPAYRMPRFQSLMIHLWDKTKHYIQKVFTVILLSTIAIWFLSNFGWNWQMTDIENSILASIGQFVQPIFTPLGFGSQLGALGWVFAVAAVMGLIAKENVIAAFLTLATMIVTIFSNPETASQLVNSGLLTPEVMEELMALIESGEFGEDGYEVLAMVAATGITWQGLISFIVFNMATIPCFAAVATAKGELGKGKFKWTLLFWIASSFIASSITYVALSWWWTSFIFVAVIAVIIALIALYNRGKLPFFKSKENN